jgi:hypothetical protein
MGSQLFIYVITTFGNIVSGFIRGEAEIFNGKNYPPDRLFPDPCNSFIDGKISLWNNF